MSIQAAEYNSLYFNQIRVLCTGSVNREICWANMNGASYAAHQPRWLGAAKIIVLFVPFLIADLCHMLWMHFDAWKKGIILAPPLSSNLRARLLAHPENAPMGEPSLAVIKRVAAQFENTGCVQRQIGRDQAAIVFSYLEDGELGENGNFRITARMGKSIQNAKDDTWLHNLARNMGTRFFGIDYDELSKICSLSKRGDFVGHAAKLSQEITSLRVYDYGLDRKVFAEGFSHLGQIRILDLSPRDDRHDDLYAEVLQTLNSRLESLFYAHTVLLPKMTQALKTHCPNVKRFLFYKLSEQSIMSLIPHWKKLEVLTIGLDEPISKELLGSIGDHLSSLKNLILNTSDRNDVPLREFENILIKNWSLGSLSFRFCLTNDLLDAIHNHGSNLRELYLDLSLSRPDFFLNYLKLFSAMSMKHLWQLSLSFPGHNPEMGFAVFQQMITPLMNRYPGLSCLNLNVSIPDWNQEKAKELLRPDLEVYSGPQKLDR